MVSAWKIEKIPHPKALRKGLQDISVHFINNTTRINLDEESTDPSADDVFNATAKFLDDMLVPLKSCLSRLDFEEQHLQDIFRQREASENGSLDTLEKALNFIRNLFSQLELAVGDRADPLHWPSLRKSLSDYVNVLEEVRNQADLNLANKHGYLMIDECAADAGGPPEVKLEACEIKEEPKDESGGDVRVKGCRCGRGGKRAR